MTQRFIQAPAGPKQHTVGNIHIIIYLNDISKLTGQSYPNENQHQTENERQDDYYLRETSTAASPYSEYDQYESNDDMKIAEEYISLDVTCPMTQYSAPFSCVVTCATDFRSEFNMEQFYQQSQTECDPRGVLKSDCQDSNCLSTRYF